MHVLPYFKDRILSKITTADIAAWQNEILKKTAEKAGVKKIRIHDIRHSHASCLIDLGANPMLIASRLGHDSPDTTLKIYSHMFPSSQSDIVSRLEKLK